MSMKRHLGFLACSAAMLLPPIASTPANADVPPGVFSRTLHFVYARTSGKAFQGNPPGFNHTEDELVAAFHQVPKGVTALVPFFLNVTNVAQYDTFIKRITNTEHIVIVPGVGADPDDHVALDDQKYKTMADNVYPYTKYIRLENLQGYLERGNGGQAAIQRMINYLTTKGFEHIMMNPWPVDANKQPIHFTNDARLDSTIYQVRLAKVSTPQGFCPDHSQDSTNWGLPGGTEITNMLAYKRVKILINYESAPQHEALTCLERQNPGSSKAALNTTATAIENYTAADLHWNPPFTTAYDPVGLGTWAYEAGRLNDF